MTTPVYICTGFLDSGKTTFIKDTLMKQEWIEEGPTLLLQCEEGEEEYSEKYLDENEKEYMETYAGFVNSAVDRLIPPRKIEGKKATYTIVEDFNEWIADETLIKGELTLKGMIIG